MAAFKYKFRALTDFKDTQKKKVEKEVADINKQINALTARKTDLLNKLNEHKEKDSRRVKASEMHFLNNYKDIIDSEIRATDERIDLLNTLKDEKMNELIEKNKEHKVLKKLEEKHYESFRSENLKMEVKTNDEAAVLQFVRIKNEK